MRVRRRCPAYRPYRCDTSKRVSQNKSALLETINGYYAAALDRLPVDEMPGLIPRLLKAGLCVGFADPISNIIVNSISYSRSVPDRREPAVRPSDDGDKEKRAIRRRRKALSRAINGARKVNYWPPARSLLRDMSIAERSLVALVAFLTYYFKALTGCEALEYLRLANANLTCAVQLVEEDRNSRGSFSHGSRTTKTALKCAALAACHPKPRALVNRSYSLASRKKKLGDLLGPTSDFCLSCTAIENINGLLIKPHRKLGSLVASTPAQFFLEKPPFVSSGLFIMAQPPFALTKSLQSTLLHKIYEFYLKALAFLPVDGLRRFYHRSLLKAGYCFGPSADPVSNIVLNTLWYHSSFPPEGELSMATMICSRALVLVAHRSIRGLVAYIRTCFRTMSENQAMHYLLLTGANLWEAIQMARKYRHTERTMSSLYGPYKAAAVAAQHPNPDAVVDFFVSTFPMMQQHLDPDAVVDLFVSPFPMMQQHPNPDADVDLFVSTFPKMPTNACVVDVARIESFVRNVASIELLLSGHCSPPNGSVETVPELTAGGSNFLSCILKDFKEEESFVCRKVNAMLKKYTQQTRGPEYDLHVICGLNSNVGAGCVFGLRYGPLLSWRPRKTQFSHINFLARPRGCIVPILFFAECSNDEDAVDELSCWPIMGHPGRCYYCENEGAKIIHPDLEKYIGRDIPYERMACKSNVTKGSICDNDFIIDFVDICEEDCIYFDAGRDAKCAEFLNARARSMQRPRLV